MQGVQNQLKIAQQELSAREREVLAHVAEENRLEDIIDDQKNGTVERAVQQGSERVASLKAAMPKACADWFFDRVAEAQLTMAELVRKVSLDGRSISLL